MQTSKLSKMRAQTHEGSCIGFVPRLGSQSGKLRLLLASAIAAIMASATTPAMAQLQRSVVNTGFEANDPAGPGAPNYEIYSNSQVVGWDTTTGFIELWESGFLGVNSASGNVFAEMNAYAAGELYQNVCLVNGETIRWKYAHRRRGDGGPATQTVNFQIANSSGTVLQTLSTSAVTDTTAWTIRDGTTGTVYTGATGVQRVQFSTPDAGSSGNFLDDITVTLGAYVEFQPAATSSRESAASPTLPSLQISGSITAPLNVTVTVTGGSATRGTDYTTPGGGSSFVITIPAGNYNATQIPTGITILNDNVVEGSETINLSITPDPTKFTIASTTSCGAVANSTSVHTIKDDMIAPVNDSVSNVNGGVGNASAINAYTNDLFENNPVVISNIVGTVTAPATPIGGGLVPTLNVATGVVSVPANTPSGIYSITYKLCELADATNCNTAIITVSVIATLIATDNSVTGINGVAGATSVLNAFTGDTLNGVAASASNSTLSVASGSSVPTGLTFNTATGTVGVAAGTAPGVYTFNYQICETANAANCKVAAISVTVAPYADLMITKTDGVTIVYRGTSTTYTLVVTNNGVNSITGAIVKDTPVSGLTCPSGNPVTITGSGVPAGSFTIANLMGVAGITLGILNSGESATLSYTCTIT